ncbi:ShlB/FhaC/HecB family hemolysin secretion/activation protein [uncultured Dialister sp.]|uniref:ShlB/FhaC/HecB family hemolysin secretion/activation protein n=1 Tax=uncultured Dialister sp. TaxID=278064 RepID=UPI0026DC3176|nr:ShlB/FhaC/HecB family hemolysin secretion/activation protein [uncultured Dialister sp.]
MNRKKERMLLVLAALAAMPAVSLAAEPPVIPDSARTAMEAGRNQAEAMMRRNEWKDRQRQISQTRTGVSKVETPEEETPSLNIPESEKVLVKDFIIDGQDVYPEDRLKALLADKKGKKLSFNDIQDGADRITRYFREKGYIVAKTYIPPQDVTAGVVHYRVEIGRFDRPAITNKTNIRDSAIEKQAQAVKEGEYVTRDKLERAVWLVSDMAGADARVALSKGSQPGTVKLDMTVEPYVGKHGLISADNYGSRAMGYNEYSLDYDFWNPARNGDHLMASISTTGRHMFNWGANYITPLAKDGLKLTVGYNVFSYDMGDEWAMYKGVGTSRVTSLGLDYAIRRSRRHNLYTGIRFEHSEIKDEYRAFDATYGDKNGNALVFSLYGDDQDTAGMTDWRVDWKLGHINNKAFHSDNLYARWMAGDPDTNGDYSKIRGRIERHQNINNRSYLLLSAYGQYAFTPLDSSEHFSLGGPYGVKAYPTSEGSGDSGYITRAEYRWLIPVEAHDQQLQLAFYAEHGGVWIDRNGGNSGSKNHRNLQGLGIGIIWQRWQDWFIRADYAWKLGGEDPVSDTSHNNGRFWIRGGFYF